MVAELTLTATKAAIPRWRARDEELYQLLLKVRSDAGWTRWKAKEQRNDDTVRRAFAKDTADRNSRNTVMNMPVRDIIRFAETGNWR